MNAVTGILSVTGKIVFLLLILLAFVVSWLILFRPDIVQRLNKKFDTWFSTAGLQKQLETSIPTSEHFFRYRWAFGVFFILGALFTLKFFLLEFNEDKFIAYAIDPQGQSSRTVYEILVSLVKWIFVILSILGIGASLLLLFQPRIFQQISRKLDTAISTSSVSETLDTPRYFDQWILDNHTVIGFLLFIGSTFLLFFYLFFVL